MIHSCGYFNFILTVFEEQRNISQFILINISNWTTEFY